MQQYRIQNNRNYLCGYLSSYRLLTRLFLLFFYYFLSPDFRVACLKGASKLSILENFTDRVKWDNTDEIVKMCANLTEGRQYKLFALGWGGVCLSGKNMTVKYNANDTYNATCNHGIGMEDNMFVYSLGKHGRSILTKRLALKMLL